MTQKHYEQPCEAMKSMKLIVGTLITGFLMVSATMLKFSYDINSKMARVETKVENMENSLEKISAMFWHSPVSLD